MTKEIYDRIIRTWTIRNLYPKFHLSEQKQGFKRGAHGDYVEIIPQIIFDMPKIYNTKIYLMIEAKQKEKAVFKLLDKYFKKIIVKKKIHYIPK